MDTSNMNTSNMNTSNMNTIESIENILQKSDMRLSWDEYFISLTLLLAARSPSKRLKVGSVIVNDNRIISSGYNGFPASTPHISIIKDNHEINTIHAEINTICDAAKRGVSIEGATIYINYFPCIYCTKSIIASGIKKVVYYRDYHNDDLVHVLFKNSNIDIRQFSNVFM
jgi:dCMP deaminase